jgi:ribosomal protein S18 acetylase RimI-like enzyme
MEYRYARLDAGFVDEILALQQRCWEYDGGIFILSSRALIERAFQFDNYAFGAFDGGALVGFITFSVPGRRARMNLGRHFGFSDEALDRVAHAGVMVIDPTRRRRGIGSELFRLAMEALPERVEYVMTTTRAENALARRLLEKKGMRLAMAAAINGRARLIYAMKKEAGAWPGA